MALLRHIVTWRPKPWSANWMPRTGYCINHFVISIWQNILRLFPSSTVKKTENHHVISYYTCNMKTVKRVMINVIICFKKVNWIDAYSLSRSSLRAGRHYKSLARAFSAHVRKYEALGDPNWQEVCKGYGIGKPGKPPPGSSQIFPRAKTRKAGPAALIITAFARRLK